VRRALAIAVLLAAAQPAHGQNTHGQNLDERRRTLASLTTREDALAARIGADRHALARLLGALELFSRDPPPPLLVSPRDARDAVRAMILAKALTPQLEARAHALAAEADTLNRLRRQADEASGDLFTAESEIEDRQGRLNAVASDADLMAPPSARAAALATDAEPAPAALLSPTDARIAVRYGGRLGNGLSAEGVAYRPGAGAPVRSPAAAVVAYAGPLNGWGEVVILRAGGGCHMVLSGLGKVSVAVGQSVAAGAPIGDMPTDGQSQPELYLEVRFAGGPVDPARLMGGGRGANVNAAARRVRRQGVD
jgi:septal ring factor EnvC (AmiA/AmiB activator)